MNRVTSNDGTTIAFDQLGHGQPVIVVGGQLADRALTRPTAEELAKHFAVFNYDRRGRGDSGDTAPYALEREIEDLGALIEEAGGKASMYSHSSRAALALHAVAASLPIPKLVVHEPPYNPEGDEDLQRATRKEAEHIKTLLAEDRRGNALEYFWRSVGMPQEMVDQVRNSPRWAELEAMAPTMAYDSEVMGDISRGGTIPADLLDAVTIPTLVLVGVRYVVGMLELAGAVGVLIPRLSGLAALGLVGLMAGATLTNVLVLGTSPLLPIVLLVVSAVVAWGRWPRTKSLFTNREAWRLR